MSKITETYEVVPIETVRPNPDNPRTITDTAMARLTKSVRDLPAMLEVRPVLVDAGGLILGGNMRYRAAVALGMKKIPVLRLSGLTKEQARALILKDNHHEGEWDKGALQELYTEAELMDFGLNITFETPDMGAGPDTKGAEPEPDPLVEIICPHCAELITIKESEL